MRALSAPFQKQHPILYRFLIVAGVTGAVYVIFRYLLKYFFPFILAYLFMRMLLPVVSFLKKKWHFPGWLAYGSSLIVFFSTVLGGAFLVFWQLWKQIRLFLTNFPVYRQLLAQMYASQTGRFCRCMDSLFCMTEGTSARYLTMQVDRLQRDCYQMFSDRAGSMIASCFSGVVQFLTVLLIIAVSMVALCRDMQTIHASYRNHRYYYIFHRVAVTLKESGLAYLKSQGIILCVIWFLCSAGLMLIKNPYGILIGLGIAVFDTFPVLGSGMILGPWGLYRVFAGDYYGAAVLFTVLLLCVLAREFLESHMMGNHMGLLPFYMTAAIYVGVCLFGVCGIFLGPFGVILIRSICEQFP